MIACRECHRNPASGLWRATGKYGAKNTLLCAACGFRDYAVRRVYFDPDIHVELVKSITTKYVPAQSAPVDVPEKHWAEHSVVPEATGIKGKPLTQIVADRKRAQQSSTVAPSILNSYRR